MTSRSDIRANKRGWRRLSYTCRCGWVDWGHALPGAAQKLKSQMDTEKTNYPLVKDLTHLTLNGDPAFVVNFGLQMGASIVTISNTRHYIVKKGLSKSDRESVALGIYLHASHGFEKLQGAFPFSIFSGASSYSPEDLVSNVIGFYQAFRSIPEKQMRSICGDVGETESFRVWDTHLPNGLKGLKNNTARPILFPSPKCSDQSFPSQLNTVKVVPSGKLWVKLSRQYLPGAAVNVNRPMEVNSSGRVIVK